ncbi:hypothetical protein TNCV_4712241 [Trichonephila clavipes]|nr:hypothetical protein TNCV_4712241 [Trichonephila clavipes]
MTARNLPILMQLAAPARETTLQILQAAPAILSTTHHRRPPKVNYWDERSRKRREMKEAAQARAETVNPTMVVTTQSRAPTPPPVSAVHAPTPSSRPSLTSQSRQYSTAASNSTSNPIEPNITSKTFQKPSASYVTRKLWKYSKY